LGSALGAGEPPGSGPSFEVVARDEVSVVDIVVVMTPHLVSSTVSSTEDGTFQYNSMITPQYTMSRP
jgi:hypothetical protein